MLKAAFQEDFFKNGQNGFLTSVILHFFCVNPWLLLCIEVFSTFMSWAIHTHLADFGGKAFLVKDHLSSLPCLILVADQVAQKPPSSAPIIVNFCRIKSNDWRDVDYNCPETVPRLITRVWMAHDITVLNTSMQSSSQGLTQKKCKITLVRNPFWPFLKKSS